MTYSEIIAGIPKQFSWQPVIINQKSAIYKQVIIAGMGGSRTAPDLLKMLHPELDIRIHSNFGLPTLLNPKETIFIASSYSGNTAETVSALEAALEQGLSAAVIASDGKLLEMTAAKGLPHVVIPEKGIPPRTAIGYSFAGLCALLGIENILANQSVLFDELNTQAKDAAETLQGGIPLIYTSEEHKELGYLWKTVLNETAKVPAFCNRYPEVLHNEIASFDSAMAKELRVVLLGSHDRLLEFLKEKNIPHVGISYDSIVSLVMLAHLTALQISEKNGVDPISTPAIEEFKKLA